MPIAAFDFDNTLSTKDMLIPFLIFVNGKTKTAYHLLCTAPSAALFLLGLKSRQEVKERLLSLSLSSYTYSELEEKGQAFADQIIPQYIRPEGMKRVLWHQKRGDRCILISANLNLILEPWFQQHPFNDLICSQLATDGQGNVSGCLVGKNCWGEEKVRQLEYKLGPKNSYELYAYGDSEGDLPFLKMADHRFYKHFPDEA